MNTAPPAPPIASWDGVGVTIGEILDRLAAQRRPVDGGPPLTLAGVLNLIVHVPGPGDLDEMRGLIERLAGYQPSRAVMLVESDDGRGIDAAVSTSCRLSGGNVTVGVELVVLHLHGDGREGDASAIRPLLRPSLPTLLWWPGPPDLSPGGPLARLAPLAGRAVTETGRSGDGCDAIGRLAAWVPTAPGAVTDLAWAAITPWRQLIAQMLDVAELRAPGGGPLEAVIAHPGARPTAEALLLAGWLHDLAGDRLALTTEPRPGGDAAVVAIELTLPERGRRISIERGPGRQAATVCVGEGGRDTRRMLPLPETDRGSLLAGELEIQRRDHAFERALPFAAEVACR